MRIPAGVDRVLQYLSQPQGGSTLGPISDGSDSRAQRQPKPHTVPQILIQGLTVLLHQGETFSNDLRLFSKLISWCFLMKQLRKLMIKCLGGGKGKTHKFKSCLRIKKKDRKTENNNGEDD